MKKEKITIFGVLGLFMIVGFLAGCTAPIETPPLDNTTPENPPADEPSEQLEGDRYFVNYEQDILSYNITVELPNPCYEANLASDVIETEEGNAEVLLDITTTAPEEGTMCAQVIDYRTFTGKINFTGEGIEPVLVTVRLDGSEVYTKNLS
jgi:hypothetical protein